MRTLRVPGFNLISSRRCSLYARTRGGTGREDALSSSAHTLPPYLPLHHHSQERATNDRETTEQSFASSPSIAARFLLDSSPPSTTPHPNPSPCHPFTSPTLCPPISLSSPHCARATRGSSLALLGRRLLDLEGSKHGYGAPEWHPPATILRTSSIIPPLATRLRPLSPPRSHLWHRLTSPPHRVPLLNKV